MPHPLAAALELLEEDLCGSGRVKASDLLRQVREELDRLSAALESRSAAMATLGRKSAATRRVRHGTAQPSTERRSGGRSVMDADMMFSDRDTVQAERYLERDAERLAERSPERSAERLDLPVQPVQSVGAVRLDSEQQEQPDQEQGLRPPVRTGSNETPNDAVLVKLAHTLLDEIDAGLIAGGREVDVTPSGIADALKARAAAAGLVYTGRSIAQALEAVDWQRPRQTPLTCAVRLLREVVQPAGPAGVAADDVRAKVYERVQAQYPAPAFAAWRDAVLLAAWEETTWRTAAGVLEIVNGRLRAL